MTLVLTAVLALAGLVPVVVVAPAHHAMAAGQIMVPAQGQSPTIDKIKSAGVLRAGVIPAPPLMMLDTKTNQYFGPSVSLGQAIAKALAVKLQPIPTGWDTVIAGVQAQQFDLALAPLFATPQRKAAVDFVTYYENGTCYAVLKTNTKINKLEDLNNSSVTIGTFTGTGTETAIHDKYPNATLNSQAQGPGGGTRILEVITKRIDVAPFDSPLALAVQNKYPQVKILPESASYCINHSDVPIPVGMAFNKGDAAFARFLQSVIDSMQSQTDADILKYSNPKFLGTVAL